MAIISTILPITIPLTVDSWNYQDMKFVLGDQLSDDCSKGGSDAGDRVRITEIALSLIHIFRSYY